MHRDRLDYILNSRRWKRNRVLDTTDVILVAMPWARLEHPSIQIGTLCECLRAVGIRSQVRSYYLAFMEHLHRATLSLPDDKRITVADYDEIATHYFLGDSIFSVRRFVSLAIHPTITSHIFAPKGYQTVASLLPNGFVPSSLTSYAPVSRTYLALTLRIVGFTTTFGQNVPSLVLAKLLKTAFPEIKILFGGANCDGVMGAALQRAFPMGRLRRARRGRSRVTAPRL